MSTQTTLCTITRASLFSLAGMTALFFACDTHMITNPDSMEEVETAIGAMTDSGASPLFIVNGEIVQDISHIDAADIESVRLIRGSDVTAFRLGNAMESTSGRLTGSTEAFQAVHGQEAEGRRMIIRGADTEEQETEGTRMIIRGVDSEGQETEGIRMIIKGEKSEPGQETEGRRIIRNPDAEHSSGQPAMLRNTSRELLVDELEEKIFDHPDVTNGVVIITLRSDNVDASGSEK